MESPRSNICFISKGFVGRASDEATETAQNTKFSNFSASMRGQWKDNNNDGQDDFISIGQPMTVDVEDNEPDPLSNSIAGEPKKWTPAWQQEVRDEQGRRRFHGAFTGGFSAGFYNTVG
jgi:hypothetical protein